MYIVSMKDSNNKIGIAASAVAQVENADVYNYIFRNVKIYMEKTAWINKRTTTAYIVDGHKGSAAGIPAEVR